MPMTSVHPFKVINNKATQNIKMYAKDYDAQVELCSDFVRLACLFVIWSDKKKEPFLQMPQG
jgi:hypothetical protein